MTFKCLIFKNNLENSINFNLIQYKYTLFELNNNTLVLVIEYFKYFKISNRFKVISIKFDNLK